MNNGAWSHGFVIVFTTAFAQVSIVLHSVRALMRQVLANALGHNGRNVADYSDAIDDFNDFHERV